MEDGAAKTDITEQSAAEVFFIFLKLGLTSFGGPVAHLGYFREEFVARRKWLDEASYADLVALCQFLPGPASSQVGLAVGLSRAGYLGALAAWVWTAGITSGKDFALAVVVFLLLFMWQTPPWLVVILSAAGAAALAAF